MDGPYNQENCFWREPENEWERRTGIEQLSPSEPDEIPITKEEMRELKDMNIVEKRMFIIWKRMIWRAENYPLHDLQTIKEN